MVCFLNRMIIYHTNDSMFEVILKERQSTLAELQSTRQPDRRETYEKE